jgi:hypothetical protein
MVAMQEDTVVAAVRQLRVEGQRVTLRAVHAITGGSHRDLTRLLRGAKEFLADDEVADLDEEAVESSPRPSLGRIVESFQAAQLADHEAGVASAVLDERLEQLRGLMAHPPAHAIVPDDVAPSVEAQRAYKDLVSQLEEEVHQLQRIVQAHQAEARAFRVERDMLYVRAQELRDAILPSGRRSLVEAQQNLQQRKAELIRVVQLAEQRVERLAQVLTIYEAELAALTGESR